MDYELGQSDCSYQKQELLWIVDLSRGHKAFVSVSYLLIIPRYLLGVFNTVI